MIYSSVLLLIVAAATWSLATRVSLKVDVLRDRSMLYREADDERIENAFTLRVMNTDEAPHRYAVGVTGIDGIRIDGEAVIEVPAVSSKSVTVVASVPDGKGRKGSNPIMFDIRAQDRDGIVVHEKASFFLP